VTSALMTLALHDPEVVFSVLVAVFHLDRVAGELRLPRPRQKPLILLPCVGRNWRATRRLPLSRHSSYIAVHRVPFVMRVGPLATVQLSQDSSAVVGCERGAPALSSMRGPAPRMTHNSYMGSLFRRLKSQLTVTA